MQDPYFTEIDIAKPGDLGGGSWTLSGLTTITALFGKNGSGKSRLLRARRDKAPNSTHYVIPERTGEMTFVPSYLQNQINAGGRKSVGENNFLDSYRRHVVTRIQAYFWLAVLFERANSPATLSS